MKNKIVFIIPILLVIGVICYYIFFMNVSKEISLNESVKILMNNTYTLKDNDKYINVILIDAKDGRCPEDVECIWEGELEYTFQINDTVYKLGTRLNKKLSYEGYSIELDNNNDSVKYANIIIKKEEVNNND